MPEKMIDKLSRIIDTVDSKQEYDVVADLKSLLNMYGVLKSKDYRKKLNAIIEKYEKSEITEIRAALLEKCRSGDPNAIRLYIDSFRSADAQSEDDGLTAALLARGKDVFGE